MNVCFVTPAWSRYEITRLALAQRAHLRDELAAQGINMSCVVVADDDNLDLAAEYGFATVEMSNEFLGARVNAGIEWAGSHGADWICYAGSDNWLHPTLFAGLDGSEETVIAGRLLAIVDMVDPRLKIARVRGVKGAAPWLIHRSALEPTGFRPALDTAKRGLEMSIYLGMARQAWAFKDPCPLGRVDFKSDVNMTPFGALEHLSVGEVDDPWLALAGFYPDALVRMARLASESLMAVGA